MNAISGTPASRMASSTRTVATTLSSNIEAGEEAPPRTSGSAATW